MRSCSACSGGASDSVLRRRWVPVLGHVGVHYQVVDEPVVMQSTRTQPPRALVRDVQIVVFSATDRGVYRGGDAACA